MANEIIQGSDIMVFIENGSGNYESIGFATSHQLSLNTDTKKVLHKDSKVSKPIVTGINAQIQVDHLFSVNGFKKLFDIFKLKKEVVIAYSLKNESEFNEKWTAKKEGEFGFKSKAIISSLTNSAPVEGEATFSATFEISDELEDLV